MSFHYRYDVKEITVKPTDKEYYQYVKEGGSEHHIRKDGTSKAKYILALNEAR